ncbi:MAG TPA: hypothetical protein DCW72_08350 [Elusimicrobia bacterium]|nr:MAG: hypothetical protein A2X29_05150 [Elusimicrobia bacterium GWA2_64_40]OGR63971.1 MAG: hypothetical protein A2X30_07485 [Elusimicrobia bacterium GWB2_63_16]HAN04579.1 hypothetical protein [Elusimicrobiota bacterium]HAU90212.1 hypothetical protein [Elusimicrobiota bacterium]
MNSIKSGWDLIKYSTTLFLRHPVMLMPLLFTWLLYAPTVLYFKYRFDWDPLTLQQTLLTVLGITFFFALLLAFSASMLLELIQQAESGRELSLTEAFADSLGSNLLRMLPIVVVWTLVWFVLTVLTALLTRKKRGSSSARDDNFSAENAARTLAGDTRFSLSAAFFRALNKGVRMAVFLVLPAIAWQNQGPWDAFTRGMRILRMNIGTFMTGYALSELAATIVFIPPAILLYISSEGKITFPEWVWFGTIAYIALAWSYSIYLEQMFTAMLYLWHLNWEKAIGEAQAARRPIPALRDVRRPCLLDGIDDLAHLKDCAVKQQ